METWQETSSSDWQVIRRVRQHQKKGKEHPGLIAVAVGEPAGCNGRVSASASVLLPLSWHQGLTDTSSSASVFQIPIC